MVGSTAQLRTVVRTVRQQAAPGELELIRAFINTRNLERGSDMLDDPDDLRAWLAARFLIKRSDPVGPDELIVAVAVREALRDHAGGDRTSAAVLDAAAAACGLRPRFEREGLALAPAVGGVPGALGRLLGIVVASITTGRWDRLKTCRNPNCRWVFYDTTRNRSAVWCDMAVCGSRAKSRAYYARRRSQSSSST
jgi:predicted RNA-binding Zn ribbon-like protein